MPRKGFGWYQISCLCTDGFFFFFKYSTLTTERSGFIEGWRGHWTCLELFSLYTFLNTFCAPKKAPSVTILVWHGYNVFIFCSWTVGCRTLRLSCFSTRRMFSRTKSDTPTLLITFQTTEVSRQYSRCIFSVLLRWANAIKV